jgi:hypothetical protein
MTIMDEVLSGITKKPGIGFAYSAVSMCSFAHV